jgi:hypothetical protein
MVHKTQTVYRRRNLSGGKSKNLNSFTILTRGFFGNPKPQHFGARWAGWIPGINKKGKRCKVFGLNPER